MTKLIHSFNRQLQTASLWSVGYCPEKSAINDEKIEVSVSKEVKL